MADARRYAADTSVPVERSRSQLEQLLRVHGAQGFATGWDQVQDRIEFLWKGMQIRFILPKSKKARAQADRQRWRALYLVVRAKLESIESGIAVFEQEFLGFIVNPQTNATLYEQAAPRLKAGEWDASRLLPPAEGN